VGTTVAWVAAEVEDTRVVLLAALVLDLTLEVLLDAALEVVLWVEE